MKQRQATTISTVTRPESAREGRTPPRGNDRRAWGDWLNGFAWDHFVTLTTDSGEPFSAPALERAFNRYVASLAPIAAPVELSWFRAIEPNERGNVHALLAGTSGIGIRALRDAKLWPHGNVHCVKYDGDRGAPHYCTKRIGKGCDDYDISAALPPTRVLAAPDETVPLTVSRGGGGAPLLELLIRRWEARQRDGDRLSATVPLSAIAAEVLADLHTLRAEESAASVGLIEAAARSGYSADHIGRLIASGTIENVGRKGKPRIRVSDIPRKPGRSLRARSGSGHLSPRRQVVASVVTGKSA